MRIIVYVDTLKWIDTHRIWDFLRSCRFVILPYSLYFRMNVCIHKRPCAQTHTHKHFREDASEFASQVLT